MIVYWLGVVPSWPCTGYFLRSVISSSNSSPRFCFWFYFSRPEGPGEGRGQAFFVLLPAPSAVSIKWISWPNNTEFSFIKHFIAIWALGCWSVISQIWDFYDRDGWVTWQKSLERDIVWRSATQNEASDIPVTLSSLFLWENRLETLHTEEAPGNKVIFWVSQA